MGPLPTYLERAVEGRGSVFLVAKLTKCSIRIRKEHSNTNIQEIAQKNRISNIEFESNTITITEGGVQYKRSTGAVLLLVVCPVPTQQSKCFLRVLLSPLLFRLCLCLSTIYRTSCLYCVSVFVSRKLLGVYPFPYIGLCK